MLAYISHSRQNAGLALKLSDRLARLGVDTWLDLRELDSGADWFPRVAEAIRTADGFIFLVGPESAPDPSQRFEWQQVTEEEYYLDPQKPLIPVIIGAAELPGFLKTRQAITVESASIDFDLLAERVAGALSRPGETVDHEKLERGREARRKALDSLRDYSRDLEEAEVKRAGLRGLE